MRLLAVRLPNDFTACRTRCKDKPLKLHRGNDVRVFSVTEKRHVKRQVNVKSSRDNYCTHINIDLLRFLLKIYSLPCTANINTFETFNTVIFVDGVNQRHCLVERHRNSLARAKVHIPLVRKLNWTGIFAFATARALVGLNEPWPLLDF